MIGTTGVAECGQNLGHVDQGGAIGGDQPAEVWEVYHIAESARGLLAWIDQYGAAEACYSCARHARQALNRRGRADLLPPWAQGANVTEFYSRIATAWPQMGDAE